VIGTASFPVSEDIEITAPVLAPSGSKDDVNATAVATEVVCEGVSAGIVSTVSEPPLIKEAAAGSTTVLPVPKASSRPLLTALIGWGRLR